MMHVVHPQISGGMGVEYGKVTVFGRKPAVSLKQSKIEQAVLLATDIKYIQAIDC